MLLVCAISTGNPEAKEYRTLRYFSSLFGQGGKKTCSGFQVVLQNFIILQHLNIHIFIYCISTDLILATNAGDGAQDLVNAEDKYL